MSSPTVPIVSRQAPNAAPYDCGICNQEHTCHCPRMKGYCDICIPPISVAARNVLAHEISLPETSYQPVVGLTHQGIVAARIYRQRQALKAVS